MAHVSRDRYSELVLKKLRSELVLKDGVVFNNDYEGDPTAGSVQIPVRDTEVPVGDYDKATGISLNTGATSYLTMTIGKDKAVNEIIDGYDAKSVPGKLVADRLDSAGYSMAHQMDADGSVALLSGATVLNGVLLTKTNIYDYIVDVKTVMDTANIPKKDRYLLATPTTEALIIKSPEFISASSLGDEVKQNGIVGRISGFNVIGWNNSTANLAMIVGHKDYCSRVREWKVPVKLQDLNGSGTFIGASAVQGRDVYDHLVTRAIAVRACYNPTALTFSSAQGATSGTTILTVVGGTGSLEYKKNVSTGAEYGADATEYTGTALTSGTTEIAVTAGERIEVVDFVDDSAVAVGYIDVVASMIKA